jgi:hypothetical protein
MCRLNIQQSPPEYSTTLSLTSVTTIISHRHQRLISHHLSSELINVPPEYSTTLSLTSTVLIISQRYERLEQLEQ